MDSLEPRPSSCRVSVVELTFDPKREQPLDPSELAAALEAGRFVWIDVEIADPNEAEQVLAQLALLNHEIIQDAEIDICPFARQPRPRAMRALAQIGARRALVDGQILAWRQPELARVFAAELAGALVADLERCRSH